jgi:hypothetical protein
MQQAGRVPSPAGPSLACSPCPLLPTCYGLQGEGVQELTARHGYAALHDGHHRLRSSSSSRRHS